MTNSCALRQGQSSTKEAWHLVRTRNNEAHQTHIETIFLNTRLTLHAESRRPSGDVRTRGNCAPQLFKKKKVPVGWTDCSCWPKLSNRCTLFHRTTHWWINHQRLFVAADHTNVFECSNSYHQFVKSHFFFSKYLPPNWVLLQGCAFSIKRIIETITDPFWLGKSPFCT